ncbi:MAG: alpha/beta fold hydrolase [Gammaproteobacteria bacterium]|nr:alpha/beta fold hydrolase [Gammaproteobacteria bacterium]
MAIKLYHRSYGDDGPALVLLHGVFGSSVNWQTIAKALAADRRVVAVDLRNHGRSPHASSMTYADMVADLLELFRNLDLERPSVLGHSMGGKVAMALALDRGAAVDRLVVADMAPVANTFRPSGILAALRGLDLAALNSRADADAALAEAIPERRIRAFLLQNLVRDDDGFRWRVNLDALDRHDRELADFPAPYRDATFAGPTLFLRGEHSDYVLPEHEQAIHRLFPAARIHTLEDTGHWLHAEAPERFAHVVQEFLKGPATA